MSTERFSKVSDSASGSAERLSEANAAESETSLTAAGASPGNTHLQSSQSPPHEYAQQVKETENRIIRNLLLGQDGCSVSTECEPTTDQLLYPGAVAAIDWLEEGGLVEWDSIHGEHERFRLHDLQHQAKLKNEPVPYEIAGQTTLLYPLGIASGRQQRMTYRLEWPGVTLAFSTSATDARLHANLHLIITGEACLLQGAQTSRMLATDILTELGGMVKDFWTKRIDVCLDVPGFDLNDWLLPAFAQQHFLTNASKWNPWDGKQGCTGFTVGSRRRASLNVYDKLKQTAAIRSVSIGDAAESLGRFPSECSHPV